MLYKEYIKEAVKSVASIYGPDAMGYKLDEFKEFFEDITLLNAMDGRRIYFSSGMDMPTANLEQALIGSGIQKQGKLPIGRGFSTNELQDENMPNIIDQKTDYKMNYLVNKMRGENGEYGIKRYIEENPKSDPNAYEMVDVMTTYYNLIASGKIPANSIKEDIDNMFETRKQNFIENGIGTDSVAYRICEFCHEPEDLNDYPLPAVTVSALRKIASVDLYSRQQVRDGGILFDNVSEVEGIKNYFNASQHIKPGFLDRFKDDLEQIYTTAKENHEKNHSREYE